jgi:outer membrane murein-binding lipoprotein Lpp
MLRANLWIVIAAMILAVTPICGAGELEQLKAENKKLTSQVQELGAKLNSAETRCKSLESDLKAASQQQDKDTQKQLRNLSDDNAKLKRELDELRKRSQVAENDPKAQELKDRLRVTTEENDRLKRQIEDSARKKREDEKERKTAADKALLESQEKLRTLNDETSRLKEQLERQQRENETAQRERKSNPPSKPERGTESTNTTGDGQRDDLAALKEKLTREQAMRTSVVLPGWQDADQELLKPTLAPDALRVLLPATTTGTLICTKSGTDVVTLSEAQGDRATAVTFSLRAGRIYCQWANEAMATRHSTVLRQALLVLPTKDAQIIVSFK